MGSSAQLEKTLVITQQLLTCVLLCNIITFWMIQSSFGFTLCEDWAQKPVQLTSYIGKS